MAKRRNCAQREAARVLKGWGVSEVPVDVGAIAKAAGIRVSFQSLPSISGLFYRDHMGPVIFVEESDSKNRQRFTIAHELGHFFLHDNGGHQLVEPFVMARSGLSSEGTRAEEIQANQFAAELLMPQDPLEKAIQKYSYVTETDIEALAGAFGVSPQAMGIRLCSLGYLE